MDYRTKEEQVADYLRERIISGIIPRGSRLKQAEIAEQLRLSITPVREALKLLEAQGYVSGDSYRGARVIPFDAASSAEVLSLRLLLENQLVRGTAQKITSGQIEELHALANEFESAFDKGDRAAARWVNYRFHRQMYEIAVHEHEEILNALTAGDALAAMLAMRKHIESGWDILKTQSA
jgi:DNA-binding GntR family transcriptional regulator